MPRGLSGFLAELIFLVALAGGFLALYTGPFAAPASAILPHLTIVACFAAAFMALRMAGYLLLGDRRIARFISTLALTALLILLGGYYALVLIGLSSWGRVVSWKLITTYAPQLGDLLDVFGVPIPAAILAAAAVLLALLLLVRYWIERVDWTGIAVSRLSRPTGAILAFAGLGLAAAQALVLATEPPAAKQEPISLTFRPELGATMMQSNAGGANPVADAGDTEARRSYRVQMRERFSNVIVIVGDALRGDHMSVLGYERPTTPFLNSLDRPGRMTKASAMRSVCGESSCGLMAIAASTYAHTLGRRPFTLIEALRLHGYRTRMLLGGDHTNFYSLRDAYGVVDDYFDGSMAAKGYMNDDRLVLEQASRLPRWDGRPEFIQFHLMSTHGIGQRFEPETFLPTRHYYYRGPAESSYDEEGRDIEAINYYDNGMLQFDAVVSRLIEVLDGSGYLQDALVVVVGDHGEMLGDHGEYKHAWSVREGALDIPLVMIGYGRSLSAAATYDSLSSQMDIAPTILREAGIPAPASWRGLPLQATARHEYIHFQQGTRVGAYDTRDPLRAWKLWQDTWLGEEHLSVIEAGAERMIPESEFSPLRARRMRAELAATIASVAGEDRIDPFRAMIDSRARSNPRGDSP